MRKLAYLTMIRSLLAALLGCLVANATTATLGDTAIEASVDNNSDGQAEAFPATAQISGSLTALNVYLDASNGARTVVVGLYSSNNGHPGALLTQGTITAPVAAAWNSVQVPPIAITSGATYWIAILGLNGGIQFRDRAAGPCSSDSSQQTTLSSLPAAWTTGASWPTCPASAYGTLSVNPPPAISVTISPTSANVQSGHTAQFTAMINGSPSNAVSWTATGGTITSAGLYTAGASRGTFSVTATSTTDSTKSASATVVVAVPPPSVSISIAPTSATLAPGGTQLFTATVTGSSNTNVNWAANGGTISASGLYTAPPAPGSFKVTATSAADTSKSASATVTVSTPTPSTLGDTAIEASVDNNSDGNAEAFPSTAQTGGSLTALNVFLDASNGARTVIIGLYASNSGHPAALLTQGTITAPVAGAWNGVQVPPVAIASGATYWIAILGLNGGIQFRDRSAGPCSSESSLQTTLSTLPSAWTTGASWPTCPASAYGTLSGTPAPAISVTISPTTANIQSGQTAQFTAMINGTSSNAITWTATGGSITSSGLYSAGSAAGTFSVTAISTADNTKSASAIVVVTVPAPTVSVSISPRSATLTTGGTQLFTATVTGTSNTSVNWTANGGTISTSGLYTAPANSGSFTVTATSAADTSKSA